MRAFCMQNMMFVWSVSGRRRRGTQGVSGKRERERRKGGRMEEESGAPRPILSTSCSS